MRHIRSMHGMYVLPPLPPPVIYVSESGMHVAPPCIVLYMEACVCVAPACVTWYTARSVWYGAVLEILTGLRFCSVR